MPPLLAYYRTTREMLYQIRHIKCSLWTADLPRVTLLRLGDVGCRLAIHNKRAYLERSASSVIIDVFTSNDPAGKFGPFESVENSNSEWTRHMISEKTRKENMQNRCFYII